MKHIPISAVLIFILLISCAIVYSSETQIGDKSYTINFPKNDFYSTGQKTAIVIQAQNFTGLFLDNTDISCRMQIYNATGEIISSGDMTFLAPYNFYYNLSSAITGNSGRYPYDIYCNSSINGGFASSQLKIAQGDTQAFEIPVSLAMFLSIFFVFLIFLAAYFTIQKHPLSYLFMLLTFTVADVLVWLNWRILEFNSSPIAKVIWIIFFSFALVTVIMFFVTMFDVTRLVIQMQNKKKAKENIARFGYA